MTADDQPEPESVVHGDDFSEADGNKQSWRFFRAELTNCTPWAVIANLGWAKHQHNYCTNAGKTVDEVLADDSMREDLAESLLRAFDDRKTGISTNQFARQHLTGGSGKFPVLVQVALYCQGLRYHNSKLRRDSRLQSLADPEPILRSLAREERQRVYEDRLAAKRDRLAAAAAEEARNNRAARMRLEAATALESHGAPHLPRLFTPAEVDALNMVRPPTDQLEIMPSGLLRHHCCFEGCPQYLCNMATTRDTQLGTRHGIYRHFKCFFCPDRLYYNGVHNIACCLFEKYRGKREQFAQACMQHIEGNAPAMTRAVGSGTPYLLELVEGIFDQLSAR